MSFQWWNRFEQTQRAEGESYSSNFSILMIFGTSSLGNHLRMEKNIISRRDTLDNFFIINMTYWILMKCKIGNVFDKA